MKPLLTVRVLRAGASYYFDYFSKHYFEGVNKRS